MCSIKNQFQIVSVSTKYSLLNLAPTFSVTQPNLSEFVFVRMLVGMD